jgi:hypothetical protein
MLMDRYIKMAVRVDLIRASRPEHCSRHPYQTGRRSATFSTNGCRVSFGSFEVERGISRCKDLHHAPRRLPFLW